MSKIKKITVSNLKAVSQMTADFNGCTAIVTAGNNKGKTSFLRSLFDRCRGEKPDRVLKDGETEGYAEAELTNGEKLKWEFHDKGKGLKEKLTYITGKDIKSPLTLELRKKYLPDVFDVDKFLASQPAEQRKALQKLAGLDFSDIDKRYKEAYDDREGKNRRAHEEKIHFEKMDTQTKTETVNVADLLEEKESIRTKLNQQYTDNKKANEEKRKAWQTECDELRKKHEQSCETERLRIASHNVDIDNKIHASGNINKALEILKNYGYTGDAIAWAQDIAENVGEKIEYKEPFELKLPPEPEYIPEMPDDTELKGIDQQLADAATQNQKAQAYKNWLDQKCKVNESADHALHAEQKVQEIAKERMDMIKSAKLPEGFGFTDDGITYNNLPFTRQQLSSSGIYIAALKLAAMTLGEIKTLHFDASFLDKQSLMDIEKWAAENDLQLLIERPDFDGGEIEYQLIDNSTLLVTGDKEHENILLVNKG